MPLGYTYFHNDDDGVEETSHTGPEMMLRMGLSEDIEFRLRWDYAWRFSDEGDEHGAEDIRLAFKFRVTDQSCWLPESALELRFTVPTGGDDWSSKHVDAGWDLIYGWKFTERLELFGSTGFNTNGLGEFSSASENPSRDHFVQWTQSIAIGYEISEQITVYSEIYGLFSRGKEDDDSSIFYNIGVDYYFTDDLVFDIRIGAGLTDDAEDFFSGIGGGYRF